MSGLKADPIRRSGWHLRRAIVVGVEALQLVLRRFWLSLVLVSAVVLLVQIPFPHATAWHFFEDAADLLLSSDRLHLYAARPDLQFGPISIAMAVPFTALGNLGSWAAMIAFSALGVGVVWLLFDAIRILRPEQVGAVLPASFLVAGVWLVIVWGDVSVRTAHIDDAITLGGAAAAVWAISRGRSGWAVLALTVAAAAKPWGLIFAPLAAVPPGRWRWTRPLWVAALAGLTWAPFVLADGATLDVSEFGIANEASSSLRLLGVSDALTPSWVRPTQLVGGAAVAAVLVWQGRWTSVIMAGVAFRLLIDPAANRYYTVGLVLGLVLFELLHHPARWPWYAIGAGLVLELGQLGSVNPTLSGWARLVVTVGVLGLAMTASRDPRPEVVKDRLWSLRSGSRRPS